MNETFETMMREIGRITYNLPNAGGEERIQIAFAFLCAEIDKLNAKVEKLQREAGYFD